jgi:hypothetical protein
VVQALTAFMVRQGRMPQVLALVEEAAARDPKTRRRSIASPSIYEEIVRKGTRSLARAEARVRDEGRQAAQRALEIDPSYARGAGVPEHPPAAPGHGRARRGRRQALVAEADALRNQAIAMMKERKGEKADSSRSHRLHLAATSLSR